MDKNKVYQGVEVRSFGGDAAPKALDDSRVIEGYAVVFNKRSKVMFDPFSGQVFDEIIMPSAITDELVKRSDVKALMEHNRERLLARSKEGVGTLSLSIDSVGLKYRFEAPNTQNGDEAIELIKRGDISGSSFSFIAQSEGAVRKEWDSKRGIWTHYVEKIDGLYDVTITCSPAYTQTSVDVRSLEAPIADPEKNDTLKELENRINNL